LNVILKLSMSPFLMAMFMTHSILGFFFITTNLMSYLRLKLVIFWDFKRDFSGLYFTHLFTSFSFEVYQTKHYNIFLPIMCNCLILHAINKGSNTQKCIVQVHFRYKLLLLEVLVANPFLSLYIIFSVTGILYLQHSRYYTRKEWTSC
jgi:hypothetical protein